jgi:hypothetical protein
MNGRTTGQDPSPNGRRSESPGVDAVRGGEGAWWSRLVERYNAFFFDAVPVDPAIYFRVFLALWTICYFVPRLPHLRELYAESALHVPHPWLTAVGGLPALPLWGVWVAVGGLLTCVAAFGAGFHARKVHGPIILILAYLLGYDVANVRGYGQLAFYQWLVVYCLPYDRLRDDDGNVFVAPRWGQRLAALLFSSVYLFSVLAKTIGGEGWFDGRTLYYTLRGHDYGSFLVSAWFPISLGVARVLGWATLASEVFVGVGLWHRRTAIWATMVCVGMHGMMALTMRVSILFHLLMIGHLPLFFTPSTWARLRAHVSAPRRDPPSP